MLTESERERTSKNNQRVKFQLAEAISKITIRFPYLHSAAAVYWFRCSFALVRDDHKPMNNLFHISNGLSDASFHQKNSGENEKIKTNKYCVPKFSIMLNFLLVFPTFFQIYHSLQFQRIHLLHLVAVVL